jgi:uncharacterized FlaG/YvyC family protein
MLACTTTLLAQDVTPAQETLDKTARELTTEQKAYDEGLKKANSDLADIQKNLNEQLAALNTALNAQVRADKKYKPMFVKIDDLQKQLTSAQAAANQAFTAKFGSVGSSIEADKVLIRGLVPVVRKEKNLPESSQYDTSTQTWSQPTTTK